MQTNRRLGLETTEQYEELKGTAKSFLQVITSDKLYYAIFLLVIMLVAVKMVDVFFLPFVKKRRHSIQINFLKGCCKAMIVITLGIKIVSLSDTMSGFTNQILMSSSLIVVVLGFVFQEGLSNIVHGFILTIFMPFQIGDRIHTTIDGESITGYIKSIDLRNTVIQNVMNSSHIIVPNSKMDLCVLDNQYFDENTCSSNFLDLSVTYESDLEKAIRIVEETIAANPLVVKAREEKNIKDPVTVMVRELGDSGIYLRASVTTLTVEENFSACSDIRRELVRRFGKEADVEFAYPHMQLVGADTAEQIREILH